MPLHRLVFFLGGFDPKTPRHYHRLYRAAARAHPAGPDGEEVSVGPRHAHDALSDVWDVHWRPAQGPALHTRYVVLRWDDIVLRHWSRGWRRVLADWRLMYLRRGARRVLWRVHAAAPACLRLGNLPLGLAAACLAGTGLLGTALCWMLDLPLAWAVGALPVGLGLWRLLERRLDTEWLLRLYAFTCAQGEGQLPDLDKRLDALAEALLAQARAHPAHELLVVGHSTGAIQAAAVLARALQRGADLPDCARHLGLLTLGHCTPLLAWQPRAAGFRVELAHLADTEALTWWDFSAPADWAAFAQTPPWTDAVGRARRHATSPRFHQTMSEASYAALKQDRQALHLHYLRAPERPGGYDPVSFTAGPMSLAERHQALQARDRGPDLPETP